MTNLSDIIPPSNIVTEASTDTLTNKTLTSPVLNTGVSGTAVLDEDNMASDSATKLATQQSIKAYVDSQVDSTEFVLEDDDGTEVTLSNAKEVKFIGSGITTNWTDTDNGTDGDPYDLTFSVDAAQTGITSLLATDIKIGEDDQTKIDFETADEIHFYAANVEQVYLGDNIFGPQSDSDVDLGSTGVRWKDAFVDSITVTGEVDAASLDISGNADIDGTLETDNLTVGGAQGSDGQVLTSTGSGVGWEDAAAGGTDGWELISTITPTAATTIAGLNIISSSYEAVKIILSRIVTSGTYQNNSGSGAGNGLDMRLATGGSADSGSNYGSHSTNNVTQIDGSGTFAINGNHHTINGNWIYPNGDGFNGEILILGLQRASGVNKTIFSRTTIESANGTFQTVYSTGIYNGGTVTGIQFFTEGATATYVATGQVKVYGLKVS